ncbi:MAG: hypothetical protein HY564_02375, partial [Candidatus Jacksonbacteria bacterium]|nr:hypothetical protein [Candidatus Jacksonbacteria bacterium]
PQEEPSPEQTPEPTPTIEELSEIGEKTGLQEEETVVVPQTNPNITVLGKIAKKTKTARSNRDGLSVIKGDISVKPEEVLFFHTEGVKKELVELKNLIKPLEIPFAGKEEEEKQAENTEKAVVTGGEPIVLEEIAKNKEAGGAFAVNVEEIKIKKKEKKFLQKLTNTLFGRDKNKLGEERIHLEVASDGKVKLISAENVKGDEKLEVEYSYGSYTKPFEVSFVPLTLNAPFTVSTLSSEEFKAAETFPATTPAKQVEEPSAPVEPAGEPEPEPEEEPVIEEETEAPADIPSDEIPEEPVITPAPETPEEPVVTPAPSVESPPVDTTPTPTPKEQSSPQSPLNAEPANAPETIVPVPLPEQGAVQGARANEPYSADDTIFNRVKRFLQTLISGNTAKAQSGSQTVEAFQVKLKTATEKGEQTFQILPNGLMYLYHGLSIEAISRPRFQYMRGGEWVDFTVDFARTGTETKNNTATHLIQYTTAEGDIITLKYDFGLAGGSVIKKQTWTISGDKTVRVLWETLFRAGSSAQKELALTPSVSPPSEGGGSGGRRTRVYGDIVIDASDYKGNVAIEEDKENRIVIVYFEKDGVQAPLTIDPSFSVVTGDQFIEVATPDFQSPGSETGWKIRFNRMEGGGIDQYFHNSVQNGEVNIASSTKPLFNIIYTNSALKDLSQTQAYNMEVIERGATRLRVRSRVNLGNDQLAITYTIYLAGQIYIDVQNVLQDGSIAGQSDVFRLNQSYTGYQPSFAITDAGSNAVALDGTQADTALVPFIASDVAGATSRQSEADDYIQIALGTAISAMYANGNTATNQFLLSLAPPVIASEAKQSQDEIASSPSAPRNDITMELLSALAADYQTPDSLTPFTIGTYQGYNNKEGAYEMTAQNIKVEFVMDGATTPRYQPVFKIANWTSGNLGAVFAKGEGEEIRQDTDYILTFINGDPSTQTLVFQYLGVVDKQFTFWIDPTFTSSQNGNWNIGTTWGGACSSSCVADTDFPGSGTTQATITHTVTISGANATIGGNIIIQGGGKLTFETTTGRTLTVNENAGAAKIQVGAADGST